MDDKLTANRAVVDRLVEAYANRAGSEDTRRIMAEVVDAFDTVDDAIRGLALLVLTAAERAADYSTPIDIWDPERRIDTKKAVRLGAQAQDAFRALARDMKKRGVPNG
ncbi:hypothetical protein JOF42_002439 [Microbacterium phyllosphaerae]|uniref:Uncharacterized protein n=1 Tax=Microbacterium phyllosphaerae TaxID=124798 RepID=A0ABS4WRV0_9MICO|nr:hypothetical protein [Microbacterium phyllosphaerae]MBP2378944.1 hypothetical protein [Microbacterium phyllosphaerae]